MKSCISRLVIFILLFFCFACTFRNEQSRHEMWVEDQIAYLQAIEPAASTHHATTNDLSIFPGKGWMYKINHKGLIRIDATQWVFIVTHSIHYDEIEHRTKNKIGDISIAIDHTGAIYTNASHVCGGIYFSATNNLPAQSSADFFSRFKGIPKREAWVRYTVQPAEVETTDETDEIEN